jgi:hypothetical protein
MTLGSKFKEIDESIKANTSKIDALLDKLEKLLKLIEAQQPKGKK